jgi:hypothetical protein
MSNSIRVSTFSGAVCVIRTAINDDGDKPLNPPDDSGNNNPPENSPWIKIKLKDISVDEYYIKLEDSELKELFSAENVSKDDVILIYPSFCSDDKYILTRIGKDKYSCLVKANGEFKLKWEPPAPGTAIQKPINNVYLNIVLEYTSYEYSESLQRNNYYWNCGYAWVVSNDDPPKNEASAASTTRTFTISSKYDLDGQSLEVRNNEVDGLMEIIETNNIEE